MNTHTTTLRLGSTAIAAILALSAAPAFAQSTDTAAAPAPVSIAPAAPAAAAPAPVASTPVTIDAPAAPSAAAAPAPVATASKPVLHVEDTSSADTSTSDSAATAPAAHKAATPHRAAMADKPVSTVKTAAPAEVMPSPTPAPVMADVTPAATPAPAPQPIAPAPAPKATTPAPAQQGMDEDTLELIGAGGLGVLLLAGGAFALSRRKREEDEGEALAYEAETPIAATPEPVIAAPVMAAPVMATAAPVAPIAPVIAGREETLPEGFDISRYGRHAQAAYRGPTPDNPSASLKVRLKRAAFFDKRERAAAEAGTAPAPMPEQVAAKSAGITTGTPAPRNDDQIVYRPQRVARTGFRPAFQTSRG